MSDITPSTVTLMEETPGFIAGYHEDTTPEPADKVSSEAPRATYAGDEDEYPDVDYRWGV